MLDEENKLKKWKEEIESNEVPEDRLEQAIIDGLNRAKLAQPKKKKYKRRIWSTVVAALLIITFVTSIRVSPAFANAVASIPGMEKFVEFIRDDKGILSAIENEYYQQLNLSSEKEGVTLTLDGLLADEQEMVIFYTVKGGKKGEQFNLEYSNILASNGSEIRKTHTTTLGDQYDDQKKNQEQTAKMRIHFIEGTKRNDYIFKVTLKSQLRTIEHVIPFSINKEKMPSTHYPLNQTVFIEEQKITIDKIVISPLIVTVHIKVDPANTKKIFSFEDLRLVDDKGEIWSKVTIGDVSRSEEENEIIYYLQSNYFEQPNGLNLMFNKLQALDKDEAYLLVDTEKSEILKQPKDLRFSNMQVIGSSLYFDLRGVEGFIHDPFFQIIDATGFDLGYKGEWFPQESFEKIPLGIKGIVTSYKNPLTLPLAGYPSYIEGEAKIKIK